VIVKPPSSKGGLKSIVIVSDDPSYVVIGAVGVEGIVAARIVNSLDKEPVPIELRA
jgi:hypothetical protein